MNPFHPNHVCIAVAPASAPDQFQTRTASEIQFDRFQDAVETPFATLIARSEAEGDVITEFAPDGGRVRDHVFADVRAADQHLSFGRRESLLVWTEQSSGALRARRLDEHGEPSGSPLTLALSAARAPAVAFNGSQWLIVWESRTFDRSELQWAAVPESHDFAVRGGSLDPNERVTQMVPRVAANGSNFFVAWSESSPIGGDLTWIFRNVDGDARPVSKRLSLERTNRSYVDGLSSVSCGSESCVAAGTDSATIFSSDLAVLAPAIKIPAATSRLARPLANGSFALDGIDTGARAIETIIDSRGNMLTSRFFVDGARQLVVLASSLVYTRSLNTDDRYGYPYFVFIAPLPPFPERAHSVRH